MTRYRVYVWDAFMDHLPELPPTLRWVEFGERDPLYPRRAVVVEDDEAPAELEGQLVDLTFRTDDGVVSVDERRVVEV